MEKVNKKAPYVIIIFKARGKIINKFNKSTIRAASSLEGILISQSNVGKAGLSHLCTTIFSVNLDRIGVMEMGLNYDRFLAPRVLGTEVTTEVSQLDGTVPERSVEFIM